MTQLFAVITKDQTGSHMIRHEKMQAHLDHIAANVSQLALAGPLLGENDECVGSLLIVKAESAGQARALVQRDPYYAAGVWASIEVTAFKAAAGEWVGGISW